MECFDRIRSTVSTIVRDGMDLEAAPSASSDPRLSIRHAFLAARRTKRSRNWLQPRYDCSPSLPIPPYIGSNPVSFARPRFPVSAEDFFKNLSIFISRVHVYVYCRSLQILYRYDTTRKGIGQMKARSRGVFETKSLTDRWCGGG